MIVRDVVAGMGVEISFVAKWYGVSYGQAQRVLRELWRTEVLTRRWVDGRLVYSGRQHAMALQPRQIEARAA